MALDMNTFGPALKHWYDDGKVSLLALKENPFFAMVPKWTEWTGDNFTEALIYEDIPGGSVQFSNAQTNGGNVQTAAFALTTTTDYVVAQIKNEVMLATKNDIGAFLRATTTTIDSALRSVGKSIGGALFLDGTGVIGTIGVLPGGNVFTLTDSTQSRSFMVGMLIDVISAPLSGVLRGSATINSIDRGAGNLTMSATPGGTIVGDVLARNGDNNQAAAGIKTVGLASWLPVVRPLTTPTLFGLNRSTDVVRLAGCMFDARNLPATEALTQGLDFAFAEGATAIDTVICGYAFWSQLKNLLGSRVEYSSVEAFGQPQISFRSVSIDAPQGEVKIVQDRQCPANAAYGLEMGTWTLRSRGRAPMLINYELEGLEAIRVFNADGIELRVGYYGNLGCKAPGKNIVFRLA